MVNALPGKWKFEYNINSLQYRGKMVPLANTYAKDNIVILGDSYGFGTGVNEGEQFSSILDNLLPNAHVINLSVGGWGLTQQIRRYYEFGTKYKPKIVILQHTHNDLKDNYTNKVTLVENGAFTFQDSNMGINKIKKYLSNSFLQKSQFYNFFRYHIYNVLEKRIVDEEMSKKVNAGGNQHLEQEKFYAKLLNHFTRDLHNKGIKVIMIAVNGHLDNSLYLKKVVTELDDKNQMDYLEIKPWFQNVENFGSPEGHVWGKKGHKIIGEGLSRYIMIHYYDENSIGMGP